MVRREIEVPDALETWVEEAFGDVATSRAEAFRMALAYAKREYELDDERARSGE